MRRYILFAYASNNDMGADYQLQELYAQLVAILNAPGSKEREVHAEDVTEAPECQPVYWITKWVDYSDKYGIGYQLCDDSVGVLFNDSTKMVLDAAGNELMYTDKENQEEYYTNDAFPDTLNKKVTLVRYFRNYMHEHLLTAGAHMLKKDGDELARLPYLKVWFRTRSAIVLLLSNGTLQINFFHDHAKIILCPYMGAVSYLDHKKNFRVFKLSLIQEYGSFKDLFTRLRYSKSMLERLLSTENQGESRPGSLSTVRSAQSSLPPSRFAL